MTTAPTPHVYSYGGGVQSTAMLVLAAQGYLPAGPFLFSNVGDDSEHPETLRYVREIAMDYGAAHGIEVHELSRVPQRGLFKGQETTLFGSLMEPDTKSIPIPMRMPNSGAPGTRSCTADYKIRVVQRWIKEHGATADAPVTTNIGISTDEIHRSTSRKREPYEILSYPLLTLEHRLAPRGASRDVCAQIIREAGLPVPIKSACFFCPFHRPDGWRDQARDEPELFAKSVALERHVILTRAKLPCPGAGMWPVEATSGKHTADDDDSPDATYRTGFAVPVDRRGLCPKCESRQPVTVGPAGEVVMEPHGKGPMYLSRFGRPLDEVFGSDHQLSMLAPGWDQDEGYRCGDVCDT